MGSKLLIKNGLLLTLNRKNDVLNNADLLIEDGEISLISKTIEDKEAEVIDATDMIVMPGMIDAHRHIWHSIVRGKAFYFDFPEFSERIINDIGNKLSPEDLYFANLFGSLEAINAGITTIVDWANTINTTEHSTQAIKGLQDSGIRGVFTYGLPYDITFQHKDIELLKNKLDQLSNGLLSMSIGTLSPEYVPLSIAKRDIEFARKIGCTISMHIGGGKKGGIIKLKKANLLGEDLNFVHCNTLSEDEFRLISKCGASVSITPEVEIQMQLGIPVIQQALKFNMKVSLGTDVVSVTSGDLFSQMRTLFHLQHLLKHEHGEENYSSNFTVKDILKICTMGGAQALGLSHKVGSLEPGKRADIIFIRTNDINNFPTHDPYVTVLQSNAQNVDSVFINGKPLKRKGKLLFDGIDHLQHQIQLSLNNLIM